MDGLAATLAGDRAAFFAIDASRSTRTLVLVARPRARPRLPRLPALQSRGREGPRRSSWATPAARCSASRSPRSGWRRAGRSPGRRSRPCCCRCSSWPSRSSTRRSSRSCGCSRGGPIYQGGRDHTSHRLVYRGLSEKRAVVLLGAVSAGLGATSLAYSVLDNPQMHADRRPRHVRAARPVRRASSPTSTRLRGRGARPGCCGLVVHRAPAARGGRRLRARQRLVRRRVLPAHRAASGTPASATSSSCRCPCVVACATSRSSPSASTGRLALRGRAGRAGDRRGGARLGIVAFGFLVSTRPFGDFPRSVFVVDALVCIVLVGASRFGERASAARCRALTRTRARRRTLIVGAGRSGRSLLRELRETAGRAGRRLRRRRSTAAAAAAAGRAGARRRRRDRADPRARSPDAVLVTIPDAPRERLGSGVDACTPRRCPAASSAARPISIRASCWRSRRVIREWLL